MRVEKRDKTTEEFRYEKIYSGIAKAFENCGEEIPDDVMDCIYDIYGSKIDNDDKTIVSVEEIQDNVETCLMANYPNVAKAYMIYRYEHKVIRENQSSLLKGIIKKLNADEIENQNANVDEHSFGGRIGEAARFVTKECAMDFFIPKKFVRNHENNEIYIHDLDSYVVGCHNCLSIPFDDLLNKGFNSRQTDIRPANSVNTAFQLLAVIFQLQSLQQFGGVSATHLDWTMVPFVRKSFYKHYKDGYYWINNKEMNNPEINDKLDILANVYKSDEKVFEYAYKHTERELKQAVEGMYHNLNTLQSRSGNQLPFTSINYGTCTLEEGRMVIKALLEGSLNGVGKFNKTPIFPCGIFQCMKGVNRKEGDKNYDLYKLALKSTSKRLYPNYANVDWSGNAGYDVNDPRTYFSTMGCRTANGWDINGFGQLKDGRGNICPVTIILPTIAMYARKTALKKYKEGTEEFKKYAVNNFMTRIDTKISIARDMLIERFEWICSQNPSSAMFMWENGTMAGYKKEEGIRSAMKHGTLAIGQLGLAEALQLLIGTDHTTEEGMNVAKRMESLFAKRCKEYKETYKLNFGVYYTPAENLCHTALKKFRAKYGIIDNVSDKEFFTNSMHVPVWKELNPFEKIDIESQLTGYSSAGCITYIELPSTTKHNIEALETIVNYAMDKDIPYFAINVPNDTCLECGYTDEFNDVCPKCGSKNISHLRRVTGYLTGDYKTSFNEGKKNEVEYRKKHINN